MNPQILKLQEKVDGLIVRERGLLLLAVLAVAYLLWNGLVQSGFDANNKSAQAELNRLNTQKTQFLSEEQRLTAIVAIDPDFGKKSQIQALTADINTLDLKLSDLSHGLVSAEVLPRVLEDVLLQGGNLKLLAVKTLPVEELKLASAIKSPPTPVNPTVKSDESDSELVSAGLFKHSVLLQLEGRYFDVLNYLQALESLPWRFYWDSLDYKVSRYPNAVIEVRVYTLTAEEGLLGV